MDDNVRRGCGELDAQVSVGLRRIEVVIRKGLHRHEATGTAAGQAESAVEERRTNPDSDAELVRGDRRAEHAVVGGRR